MADTPLISLRWDAAAAWLYVVRNILSHCWETYESRPNVIESRPVKRWLAELVASIPLHEEISDDCLTRLLQDAVTKAVEGVSRLPITSLESPLPAFTFGEMAYFPTARQANSGAVLSDPAEVIDQWWAGSGHSSAAPPPPSGAANSLVLETVLRTAANEDMPRLARQLCQQWTARAQPLAELPRVVISMFHRQSLSPYTEFGDNWVSLLCAWSAADMLGPAVVIDLFSYVLRHLVRHLTAYDLRVFHHFGANYPDALLLDAMFREYAELASRHADLFLDASNSRGSDTGRRLRRRALRQAWLCRSQYEGHPVPDRPTSPGENQRVVQADAGQLPEAQLIDPRSRHKRLFSGTPTESLLAAKAQTVFQQSLADLADAREQRELGMAVFLDRPLGVLKPPGEADRSVLLSYTAFSRSITNSRRDWICQQHLEVPALTESDSWTDAEFCGFPVSHLGEAARHGVVALEDAARVAHDFVFLRSTGSSLAELARQYDFTSLQTAVPDSAWPSRHESPLLLIRTTPTTDSNCVQLTAFCGNGQPVFRLIAECGPMSDSPYIEIAGIEYLTNLQVERVGPQEDRKAGRAGDEFARVAIPARLPIG